MMKVHLTTVILKKSFLHTKRTSLLYNHATHARKVHGELRISRNLLKLMCSSSTPHLQSSFSESFTKFVYSARILDYQSFFQLYHRAPSVCETGRYLFTTFLVLS